MTSGMTGKADTGGADGPPKTDAKTLREARLKSALKANMAKRKAQGAKRAARGAGEGKPDRNGI
jgi:hypothetical protein